MTKRQPTSRNIEAATSPVCAPGPWRETSWAPSATRVPATTSATAAR